MVFSRPMLFAGMVCLSISPSPGGGTRSPLFALQPSNPNGLGFGYALDVDGSILAVGSDPFGHGSGARIQGAVDVFDATTGAMLRDIPNPDPTRFASMGFSVGVDAGTIVAGATQSFVSTPSGQVDSGVALVLDAQTGALLQVLEPPLPIGSMAFGYSVSISGPLAVVGARGHSATGGVGSAYVFDVRTGDLITELRATASAPWDGFGQSVAISGTHVAVGAQWALDGADPKGAVYVFDALTGAQLFRLAPDELEVEDTFGADVALHGDRLLVGAPGDDDLEFEAGAAYCFDANTGAALYKIRPKNGVYLARFGGQVDIGARTIVVANLRDSPSIPQNNMKGELFDTRSGAWLADLVVPPGWIPGTLSVAVSGDTAYCGNNSIQTGAVVEGAVWVYDGSSPGTLAQSMERNGSGVNPLALRDLSGPLVGGTWSLEVDATGHTPSFVLLLVKAGSSSGVFLPSGELLLDLSSNTYLQSVAVHYGSVARLEFSIPPNSCLFGVTASVQAAIGGTPGTQLTNALNLVLGN